MRHRWYRIPWMALALATPASAEDTTIVCPSIVSSYAIVHTWRYYGAATMLDAVDYFVAAGKCAVTAQPVSSVSDVLFMAILPGLPGDPDYAVILTKIRGEQRDSFAVLAISPQQ